MEGKDNIKDLFSQKLGNYEAKVNPDLWAKISTQVAAGATTTAATGLSVFAKIAIGLGVSAAAITTVVLLSNPSEETVTKKPTIEVQKEIPTTNSIKSEEVNDLQIQETVQSKNFRDVRKYLSNTGSDASNVTDGPIASSTQGFDGTPDSPIGTMSTKQAGALGAGPSSEPQIVEGVSYQGMTNYGKTPVNDPDITAEIITPKAEPIKRFVNVFTPNGDNENDIFSLQSEGLTDFSVVVFNPAGDIVFQSKDPDFQWDGRDIRSGKMVESGNYMYMVSAYDAEGNAYPIYERLTIIAR